MSDTQKHTKPNVPTLRFPEFQGEWKSCNLGEIASLSKGVGISKDQRSNDGNPCILYGELYTTYSTEIIDEVVSKTNLPAKGLVKSEANDVIIPASGETAIDISTARCVTKSDVYLGGDLNIIRLKGQDGKFFSYQLNGVRKKDIAKVAQGVSIVHLHGSDLETVRVCYPSRREQEKISGLLSLIDQRIAIQNRVIEDLKKLKTAISRNLLWDNEELSDRVPLSSLGTLKNGYAFKSSSYVPMSKYSIVTIANVSGEREIEINDCNTIPFIPQDIQEHQRLKANDILISLTGNVGRVSLCCKNGSCLLNQRVGLFVPHNSLLHEYIYQALSNSRFQNAMIECGQGAAQMNIGKSDIESFAIPMTSNQSVLTNIASALLLFDSRIMNEKNMLVQFQRQKEFLSKQLFI